MADKIDYNKLIDELFSDANFAKPYMDVMKTFIGTPVLQEILEQSIKQNSVGKLDSRKFFRKIRALLIEMADFYDIRKNSFVVPNDNIWNEDNPITCLPTLPVIGTKQGTEYLNITNICERVGTDLKKLTAEDFGLLNELHKKYKKG